MKMLDRPLGLFSAARAYWLPKFQVADRSRDIYIETLRGMAIILVVLGHIIGSNNAGGMRVSDDSIFRYLYQTLEYVRMPLFTIISGWVYANKPITLGTRRGFISGKLRRLLIPMFVISTVLFLFRMIIPGTNTTPSISQLPFIYIFPYDLYWFLYSLFLIFIAISFLDQTMFFRKSEGWISVLVLAFVILILSKTWMQDVPNFFSFKGAIYLFPFFVLGIGFYRYHEMIFTQRVFLFMAAVFLFGMVLQQLSLLKFFPYQSKHSLLGIAVGISAVFLLFSLRFRNAMLAWIGSYAYGIFLFHVFFTGGTRIVLVKAGLENKWVILFSALVISLVIPILIESLIKRSAFFSLLLLGVKRKR